MTQDRPLLRQQLHSSVGSLPRGTDRQERRHLRWRASSRVTQPPPWSLDETLDFLTAARSDPLYATFVIAIALGLRRGEVIGLRWQDVDLEKREIKVRKQRQWVGGEAYEDDPKGRRRKQVLPLPAICVALLRYQRMRQAAMRERADDRWEENGYVFTTRTGRPIEPRNVYRSFTRVAKNANLRVIRLHDARHGCATLLTAPTYRPAS